MSVHNLLMSAIKRLFCAVNSVISCKKLFCSKVKKKSETVINRPPPVNFRFPQQQIVNNVIFCHLMNTFLTAENFLNIEQKKENWTKLFWDEITCDKIIV